MLEDRVRAHPLVSQCMVVGDRQPFIAALVTIDEEALPGWLADNGRPAGHGRGRPARATSALRAEIQAAIDDANRAVSKAEAIRVFRILPRDFTEATGELTPSLKVKRSVVQKKYADEIAAIYRLTTMRDHHPRAVPPAPARDGGARGDARAGRRAGADHHPRARRAVVDRCCWRSPGCRR